MLQVRAANIGASVGDDGIVVVMISTRRCRKIQSCPQGITDKPVRFIINTHYHHDHTGGNEFFQKQTPIIGPRQRPQAPREGSMAGNGGSVQIEHKPQPKGAAIITFDHYVTVHLNGDTQSFRAPALLSLPGRAPPTRDSRHLFSKSNVVHMGDDFVTYGFPFIDIDGGGSTTA